MSDIYWPGVGAVVALYGAFIVVGWLGARKTRHGGASDLLVAGRAMPLWIATLTMTATWVDGGYLLGTSEGAQTSLALGIQGGFCFGISLILGGLFFAGRMRRLEYTTLVDPFESRFGKGWAAVLMLPALFGETIWAAELMVAIGSTMAVILGLNLTTSILLSAAIVTLYTVWGGMWAVAYTDVVQLGLIPVGLLIAIPFALDRVGGWETCSSRYEAAHGEAARLVPPLRATEGYWQRPTILRWWETSAMLIMGGIPWNCYFQRVLSCKTPNSARWHSLLAGLLTMLLVVPPLLLGMAASAYQWPAEQAAVLAAEPALTLPWLLREMTPHLVAVLGLAAIVGAVTSSFSASILSAGSMLSWNVYRRLLAPQATVAQLKLVIRYSILALGIGAAVFALRVASVQQLWFFTSDLVFVLLFPQLVMALFDPRANRYGSMAAFGVSLVLRLAGGEPLLGLPALVPYLDSIAVALPGEPEQWYDPETGTSAIPFKLMAAVAGLVVLPIASRLTARWDAPRPLERINPLADLLPSG
ncbi:MAG: sodium:solute symporter family protein [Pirellulales bacterium]|nr:sodium:solute symporter family protein [Pirellulales bacterium]